MLRSRSLVSRRRDHVNSGILAEGIILLAVFALAAVFCGGYGFLLMTDLQSATKLLKRELDFQESFYEDVLLREYYSSELEKVVITYHQANFWVTDSERLEQVFNIGTEVYYRAMMHPQSDRLRRGVDNDQLRIRNRIFEDYRKAKQNYNIPEFVSRGFWFIPSTDEVVGDALAYFTDVRHQPR